MPNRDMVTGISKGRSALSSAGLIRAGDTDFGTYRLERGALVLSYANGIVEELEGDSVTFKDGDRSLGRVELLPDGSRIDGVLDSFFYTGFVPGGGVSGGAFSASYLRYYPDGNWESSRSGGASGSFESGGTVTGGGRATAMQLMGDLGVKYDKLMAI